MKLATKVQHGVAALFDLAFHGAGRAAQAREIAERQEIPLRYLEEILQELRRAGLVDARRGPRGGYALAREPSAISLADVGAVSETYATSRRSSSPTSRATTTASRTPGWVARIDPISPVSMR